MARQLGTNVENSFLRGLITEATGLNFPENAVTQESNCVFDQTGTVRRRLGIDYEEGAQQNLVTRTGGVMQTFTWRNVAGSPDLDFVVQQVESKLYFYEVDIVNPLSPGFKTFAIDLDIQKVAGAPSTRTAMCQFASGSGKLFVAHPYCDPFSITYTASTDSISISTIVLKTRDMVGVVDNLGVDERPTTLTDAHKYNLFNQGWYPNATITGGSVAQVITAWDTARTDFPSNSDVWYLYKDSLEEINWTYVDKFQLNNTPAAKGHYILDEFNQDRATASGIAGLAVVSSSFYRPSTVSFFSGRVFYSGVNYGDFGNKVYFSPVLERDEQLGQCYQSADPTVEGSAGLGSSDGGFLLIPDAGVILKLVTIKSTLIIFATNGIWTLSGSVGSGFLTDDFTVGFVATLSIPSALSFVDVDGIPFWWADGGIYALVPDQTSSVSIQSITDGSIKSYYDTIPALSRLFVQGTYNTTEKLLQWVFSSSEPTTDLNKYEYDTILNFNVQTKAFYTWKPAPHPNIKINGIVTIKGTASDITYDSIVDNSLVPITNNLLDPLETAIETPTSVSKITKFVVSRVSSGSTYVASFAFDKDPRYIDWFDFDSLGLDYTSSFVSGYKIHAEAQRRFQTNYLTVITKEVLGGSCFVEVIWDWSVPETNTLTFSRQQVYNNKINRHYQHRRLKMRGSGLVAQFRYSSETGLPFELIGWSVTESGNSGV